ncbi:MAG: single-stranded DNA-binding protein [Candidatus Solibacter usitatus]|nr:single-stranded DNA-binding protein [Candidatus Solibacter usitatus]
MSDRKYTIAQYQPKLDRVLRPLLDSAGFDLDFKLVEAEPAHPDFENPDITVQFSGPDEDLLLGNKAELLLALEHITMECLGVPNEDHSRISFDCNDYRALRIEELRLSAGAAAEKVKRTGSPFFFNPMNSRERRVIHLALRGETTLRSESAGAGPHRQVVVYPAGMASVQPPPPPPPPRRDGPGRFDRRPGGRGGDRPRGRGFR